MSWSQLIRFVDSTIPHPQSRKALTFESFTQELLPIVVLYYATAILVTLPRTLFLRLALLPVSLWMFFRAATDMNIASPFKSDRYIYMNQGLLLGLTTLGIRIIIWSFQIKPYRRLNSTPKGDFAEENYSLELKQVMLDACDLSFNLRGLGWNWSKGLRVPPETRFVTSRSSFLLATASSFIWHTVFGDFLHYSVQWFAPHSIGSPEGGSIFDDSMPLPHRYLRSTAITFLSGLTVYCAIQVVYDFNTLVGTIVFRQNPAQWPPVFQAPWLSTSLSEFWTQRWHQLFRDNFISFGGKPLHVLMGRIGGVLGAFFVSGILHQFGLWGMGSGGDFFNVVGFFLMMGFGMILEHTWRNISGYRVQGIFGRIWTTVWILAWGNILVDAWSRKGVIGSRFFPENYRPIEYFIGPYP